MSLVHDIKLPPPSLLGSFLQFFWWLTLRRSSVRPQHWLTFAPPCSQVTQQVCKLQQARLEPLAPRVHGRGVHPTLPIAKQCPWWPFCPDMISIGSRLACPGPIPFPVLSTWLPKLELDFLARTNSCFGKSGLIPHCCSCLQQLLAFWRSTHSLACLPKPCQLLAEGTCVVGKGEGDPHCLQNALVMKLPSGTLHCWQAQDNLPATLAGMNFPKGRKFLPL